MHDPTTKSAAQGQDLDLDGNVPLPTEEFTNSREAKRRSLLLGVGVAFGIVILGMILFA